MWEILFRNFYLTLEQSHENMIYTLIVSRMLGACAANTPYTTGLQDTIDRSMSLLTYDPI